MDITHVLAVVLFAGLVSLVKGQNVANRIAGGYATTVNNHKHMVRLSWLGTPICGGTLVSDKHVVSAAHCVVFGSAEEFQVVGGTSYIDRDGVWRDVDRIWVHPKFNKQTFHGDIAVLKLTTPLTGFNIAPIGLCNVDLTAGMTATISGWGLTAEGGLPSNQLRTVQMPLISRESCNQVFFREVTAGMICAKKSGKDSCQGDSGGPVIVKNRLCGVVSWGKGCAVPKYPGVYVNVNFFKEFIKNHMKK